MKNEFENPYAEMLQKKKRISPRINLINTEGKRSPMTLQKASRLALQQNLKLVQVNLPETDSTYPVYELISGKMYHERVMKEKEKSKLQSEQSSVIKGQKSLTVKETICPNDFEVKLKKIEQFIRHHFEVKIFINFSTNSEQHEEAEKLFEKVVERTEGVATVMQRQSTHNGLKFTIRPLINEDAGLKS